MNGPRIRSRLTPYALVLPGWLWLMIFFVVPTVAMLSVSTMTGDDLNGFNQTWHLSTYTDAWSSFHTQIVRSLVYGLIATGLCLIIGYPVAYWIAFRGGRYKNALLFLLLLPFFVSFIIRTQSWEFMLEDNGMVLRALRDLHLVGLLQNIHLLGHDGQILQTLERVDPALHEAAGDLYANKPAAFMKVTLPLSLPGVFAAVLLTFVPVASDYVNALILGGTNTTMIGNVIQTQYLTNLDYPRAAALSFILMGVLLVGIFLYARVLGTEDVLEMAAA
jgi:spermidine/putrescine transport system permease protein